MDRDDIEFWNDVVTQLDSVFRMLLPMNEYDKSLDFGSAAGIVGHARDRLQKYIIQQSNINMEADYSFCLEMTIKERLPMDWVVFIEEAKKMQIKLTKEQKLGMLHAV